MKDYVARPDQKLSDHLLNVGNSCITTAAPVAVLSKLVGMQHDYGKFSDVWQDYLQQSVDRTWSGEKIPHAIHGAIDAYTEWKDDSELVAIALAAAISGHHGELPNVNGADGLLHKLRAKANLLDDLTDISTAEPQFWQAVGDAIDELANELATAEKWLQGQHPISYSFKIRYLFARLIHADRLDAANHCCEHPVGADDYPTGALSLQELLDRLVDYVRGLTPRHDIDRLRGEFFNDCLSAGHQVDSGWITVKGPCGIGKTNSLAALALSHAIKTGKRRVIYAAPFNTINSQTLAHYQKVFGLALGNESTLLGDFCTAPVVDQWNHKELKHQWRSPFIVTSMVQLLESLFDGKATRVRKLSQIANSVIAIDEIQMLPTQFLDPIMQVLKILVDEFGCSVIASSATIPNFERYEVSAQVIGAAKCDGYYRRMVRTHYTHRGTLGWDAISDEIRALPAGSRQALVGVQTVAAARDAYNALVGRVPVLMLTAKMPRIHRDQVLAQTKQLLAEKKPIVLVSTTCIQAGVDISFPLGYFQTTSLDGCIQFAGRVNRNADYGSLCPAFLFETEETYSLPPGDLAIRQGATREVLSLKEDLNGAAAISKYSRRVFNRVGLDEYGIIKMLSRNRLALANASKAFRLISPTVPVLVCPTGYPDWQAMFDRALSAKDWETLQLFTVGFYPNQLAKYETSLQSIGSVDEELFLWTGDYEFGPVIGS